MRTDPSQGGVGHAATVLAALAQLTAGQFRQLRAEGAANMQDISALTPPLLMCAAVLVAIGLFLRHEMRRARGGDGQPEDDGPELQEQSQDSPAIPPISSPAASGKNHTSADSSADGGER
jgi:hypothetical protein